MLVFGVGVFLVVCGVVVLFVGVFVGMEVREVIIVDWFVELWVWYVKGLCFVVGR